MTYEERTIVRAAINAAKRAWLEEQGGFQVVEQDARYQDQKIAGKGRGRYKRTADGEAQKALKAERRKVRQLERRVEDLQVALRLAQARPKPPRGIHARLTVNSQSTGHIR